MATSQATLPSRYFCVSFGPGQTPGLVASTQTAVAERDGVTLAVKGMVYSYSDNGGEKLSALDGRALARRLLDLYLSRPDGFFERVRGQCAIVVVGAKGSASPVLAFRSAMSPVPIYYSDRALGDRLLPVYIESGSPEREGEYFLDFLFDRSALRYDAPTTPFRGIKRLAPGELLTVAPSGAVSTALVVRAPQYRYPTGKTANLEETALEVRRKLDEAVESRLGDGSRPVACELSGGLDSSFTAALAAKRKTGVTAFMYSFPKFPSHRFSEECARAVARESGIALEVLDLSDSPSADLGAAQPYRDEPTDVFWQGALFGPTTRERLPQDAILFGGYGADQIFMRDPIVMPWLLRQGRVGEALPLLADCARSLDRSRMHLLWQSALLLLPPAVYHALSSAFARRRFNPFNLEEMEPNALLLEAVPWLNIPLARQISQVCGTDSYETIRTGRNRLEFSYLAVPNLNTDPYYEPRGVTSAHPFCDSRLIDFMLGEVDWRLIHDWKNPYKNLMREAQKGLLPEQVRTRPNNEFFFNGFLTQVLRGNQDQLRSLIDRMTAPGEIGVMKDQMHHAFEEMLFGLSNNSGAKLLNAMGYELWWRDFQTSAAQWKSARAAL